MSPYFLRNIRADGDGCQIWQGALTPSGTPICAVHRGTTVSVRRWLWIQTHGALPANKIATYTCTDHRCVAEEHTAIVTKRAFVAVQRNRGTITHDAYWRARVTAGKRAQSALNLGIVRDIRARLDAGEYQIDLAAEYKLTKGNIYRIAHHLTWRDQSGLALLAQQAGMLV